MWYPNSAQAVRYKKCQFHGLTKLRNEVTNQKRKAG